MRLYLRAIVYVILGGVIGVAGGIALTVVFVLLATYAPGHAGNQGNISPLTAVFFVPLGLVIGAIKGAKIALSSTYDD